LTKEVSQQQKAYFDYHNFLSALIQRIKLAFLQFLSTR